MLHGALFYKQVGTSLTTMDPVESADANVRKFLGKDTAFLVGISTLYDATSYVLKSIKISNDLWLDSQYLEFPALGKLSGGVPTWWLPSPIPVKGGSTWTVEALASGSAYAYVILHLSYGEVIDTALEGGTIARKVYGDPDDTAHTWKQLGNGITDLDPSRKYLVVGASAISSTSNTVYAIRLRAEGFQGLTPVIPVNETWSGGANSLLNMLPEGMPLRGSDTLYIDTITRGTCTLVDSFILLTQSTQGVI